MDFTPLGWYYVNLNSRAPAWSGVNEFYNFATENTSLRGVRAKEVDINQIEEGDVVQLGDGTRFYHSLFVTNIADNTFDGIFITAHDFDSKNRRLSTYVFETARFLHILN